MHRRLASSLLILITAGGCAIPTSWQPAEFDACLASEPLLGSDPVHDHRIRAFLQSGLKKLSEDEETVPFRELEKQLKRKTCQLDLVAPTTDEISPADLHDRVIDSIVVVAKRYKCSKCPRWHSSSASGFVVTAGGVIATNYHVLKGEKDTVLGIMTRNGKVHAVLEVLAADKENDFALLRMAGTDYQPLPLRAEVRTGEPVTVISHPSSHYYVLTTGVVSRISITGKRAPEISITADYAKGSSGAPVFDATGAVIAMGKTTQSVYYSVEKGVQKNLQMVFKNCVAASSILGAIK